MKLTERMFYLLVGLAAAGVGGIYLLRRLGDLGQMTLFGATISIILVGFGAPLVISAFKRTPGARNTFISFVIVALSFPIAEVGLRIADIPKTFSYSDDVSERLEAQIGLLENGEPVQQFMPFSLLLAESRKDGVPLFLSGYPGVKTVYCREDEAMTVYQADENGFRNPPGLYAGNESFDVVLLGDSFAHGACVADGHTIADQLRALTGDSVYNLGYGGTGAAHNLGAYIEYAERKNPKNVVLLLLEGSSISRMLNDELPNPYAAGYVERAAPQGLAGMTDRKRRVLDRIMQRETLQLALRALDDDSMTGGTLRAGKGTMLRSVVDPIYRSKIFRLFFNIENTLLRDVAPGGKVPVCDRLDKARPALGKIFRYLDGRARDAGGRAYVGLIPAARFWTNGFPNCEYRMIASLTAETNVRFIDLVADISALENPAALYAQRSRWQSNHFNRDGYGFVAARIADAFKSP